MRLDIRTQRLKVKLTFFFFNQVCTQLDLALCEVDVLLWYPSLANVYFHHPLTTINTCTDLGACNETMIEDYSFPEAE